MNNSICIIDDDYVYQYTAGKSIKSLDPDKNIIQMSDGKEALDFFKSNLNISSNQPEMVFLDLNMPHMDGWEFITAFKQLCDEMDKEIPIYIISSSVLEIQKTELLSHPFVKGCFTKPITIEEFSKILSTAA